MTLSERLRAEEPAVGWVVARNPGPLTLDGTRCYVVGGARPVLLDPGPELPGHLDRLAERLAERRPAGICLTHAHADHAGAAAEAARRFGVPVRASEETLRRLGLAGESLEDGDLVEVDGGAAVLRAIRTPGHSGDHLSYLLEPGRSVFTGDLVLGTGSSAVLHPDGEVGACLASFTRLLALRPGRLYPGHGPPVEDGAERIAVYREHRVERHQQVVRAVREGARSVDEVRDAVYADVTPELRAAADASVRAHLTWMREQGEDVPSMAGLDDVAAGPEEA